MMTTSKGGPAPATSSQPVSQEDHMECCMCGDFGLSSELFRCKICQFRSQHRYCSNIYPKAESYRVCNWCLNEKEDTVEKTQNSFNASSSNKNSTSTSDQDDVMIKNITKKKSNSTIGASSNGNYKMKASEKGSLKVNVNNRSIKKQKSTSPERSPLLAARKRITTAPTGNGRMMKENLRRTKSDIPKSVIYKHVFKNKVRRYKLLDEVSS